MPSSNHGMTREFVHNVIKWKRVNILCKYHKIEKDYLNLLSRAEAPGSKSMSHMSHNQIKPPITLNDIITTAGVVDGHPEFIWGYWYNTPKIPPNPGNEKFGLCHEAPSKAPQSTAKPTRPKPTRTPGNAAVSESHHPTAALGGSQPKP